MQSVPKLTFPGGALIGCSAGFVNLPRIKGSHNAIKSGMLAAEAAFEALAAGKTGGDELIAYPVKLKASWIWKDLDKVRNVKPRAEVGHRCWARSTAASTCGCTISASACPGRCITRRPTTRRLRPAAEFQPIQYPKPDGVISFDKLSSVFLSNTNHEEDQPVHLKLRDPSIPIAVNLPLYAEPAQRYCPAGVYEVVDRRQRPAALPDQRAELRPLQDLRHQGSGAEHRLDRARRRRRSQLPQHVSSHATHTPRAAVGGAALHAPRASVAPSRPAPGSAQAQPAPRGRAGGADPARRPLSRRAAWPSRITTTMPPPTRSTWRSPRRRTIPSCSTPPSGCACMPAASTPAAQLAPQVLATRPGDGFANLVLAVQAIKKGDYRAAEQQLGRIGAENQLGPLRDYVLAWLKAGEKDFAAARAPSRQAQARDGRARRGAGRW